MDNKEFTQDISNKVIVGIIKEIDRFEKVEKISDEVEDSFASIKRMVFELDNQVGSKFKTVAFPDLYHQLELYKEFLTAIHGVIESIDKNIENKNMFLSLITN